MVGSVQTRTINLSLQSFECEVQRWPMQHLTKSWEDVEGQSFVFVSTHLVVEKVGKVWLKTALKQ